MNMFIHTVTVYNTTTETDTKTFSTTETQNITVLRGVFMEAAKAVSVQADGKNGADSVNLYIPFGVDATDGTTGGAKQYASPTEYRKAEDKTALWTLETGKTYFVKSEAVKPNITREEIEGAYDGVYSVTRIDESDFGSPDMQHWKVRGA